MGSYLFCAAVICCVEGKGYRWAFVLIHMVGFHFLFVVKEDEEIQDTILAKFCSRSSVLFQIQEKQVFGIFVLGSL